MIRMLVYESLDIGWTTSSGVFFECVFFYCCTRALWSDRATRFPLRRSGPHREIDSSAPEMPIRFSAPLIWRRRRVPERCWGVFIVSLVWEMNKRFDTLAAVGQWPIETDKLRLQCSLLALSSTMKEPFWTLTSRPIQYVIRVCAGGTKFFTSRRVTSPITSVSVLHYP